MVRPAEFVVNFPTLFVAADWIQQHCVIPDGFLKRQKFRMYDWQLWCTLNHYRVKPRAKLGQLAPAFYNRRSQCIAPQKTGKGPWTASIVANEAVGPAVFNGFAVGGEVYDCRDHGCGCGWVFTYQPGDPMAIPWPTPLIQITAFSEDQTDNVYRPLQSMIRNGPLGERMKVGEEFIRCGDEGRIDVVTSSAQSRLGNPITFAVQDEAGIWTVQNGMNYVAVTQRRGAAGMGGRTMETSNAWDPSEDSVAQRTSESLRPDIFRFHRIPPVNLSYANKVERRKIHKYVYEGSEHVDLDAIESEAAEIMETDPANAERFFGNRVVYGAGAWCEVAKWDGRKAFRVIPDGTSVVAGFDGSDTDDWTGIRLETEDGYMFTPTFGEDNKPAIWNPDEHAGQVPRLEVVTAWAEITKRFHVVRAYLDPPGWKTEIDDLAAEHGQDVFLRFETYRTVQMHAAAQRLLTDIGKTDTTFTHDGCKVTSAHVKNARKSPRLNGRYVLAKPKQTQKIDLAVSSVLCHEAAGDVTAAKLWPAKKSRRMVVRR